MTLSQNLEVSCPSLDHPGPCMRSKLVVVPQAGGPADVNEGLAPGEHDHRTPCVPGGSSSSSSSSHC